MKCNSCNYEDVKDFKFCPECGTKYTDIMKEKIKEPSNNVHINKNREYFENRQRVQPESSETKKVSPYFLFIAPIIWTIYHQNTSNVIFAESLGGAIVILVLGAFIPTLVLWSRAIRKEEYPNYVRHSILWSFIFLILLVISFNREDNSFVHQSSTYSSSVDSSPEGSINNVEKNNSNTYSTPYKNYDKMNNVEYNYSKFKTQLDKIFEDVHKELDPLQYEINNYPEIDKIDKDTQKELNKIFKEYNIQAK